MQAPHPHAFLAAFSESWNCVQTGICGPGSASVCVPPTISMPVVSAKETMPSRTFTTGRPEPSLASNEAKVAVTA